MTARARPIRASAPAGSGPSIASAHASISSAAAPHVGTPCWRHSSAASPASSPTFAASRRRAYMVAAKVSATICVCGCARAAASARASAIASRARSARPRSWLEKPSVYAAAGAGIVPCEPLRHGVVRPRGGRGPGRPRRAGRLPRAGRASRGSSRRHGGPGGPAARACPGRGRRAVPARGAGWPARSSAAG